MNKPPPSLIDSPLPFESVSQKSLSYWKNSWLRLRQNWPAMFGLLILTLFIFIAIIIPFLTPYTYFETHLHLKNTPPCQSHWFGTDELGRDLFTRVWWGARLSLFLGIVAAAIDVMIGVLYGTFAGMSGGKIEESMMRILDVFDALPQLLIVIFLMVIMKPGIIAIIIALTIRGWINMARIIRGQILQIKENDFVMAAHMLGASRTRIFFRHLIPNCIGSIVTTMTLTVPIAIFIEAFLSFLGLGVQAPIASLGTMVYDGLPALRYYPWRLFFPATFISITMLSLNLLGDGIRDSFDPRLRT